MAKVPISETGTSNPTELLLVPPLQISIHIQVLCSNGGDQDFHRYKCFIMCQKQFSQYTCPRCNARYCSLCCYKSHNLRCTEAFTRDNVIEELQQMQPDDHTKHKMLDIVKRFHCERETDSMDEDDSGLSEEIVQKVLSGCTISFDDLTAKEKKQFQRAVASGELSKLIEPWEPWWLKTSARTISLSKDGTQLVQPLVETKTSLSSSLQYDGATDRAIDIPPGPETSLPSLKKLICTEPSPLLPVHLVDIIFSYCFTLRLYNGDWQSDPVGSALEVLSISTVLDLGGQPETVLEALFCCLERTCSSEYRDMGGLQFGQDVINDVVSLLSIGAPGIICSLCDLRRLFQAGERQLKEETSKSSKRSEFKSRLKLGERKIYFIMCWVHEQPGETWSSLAAMVRGVKSSVIDDKVNRNNVKVEKKLGARGKVVIEEMK